MDINGCKWPCGQLSGRVWAFIGVHRGGVSHGNSLFSSYGVYDSKEHCNFHSWRWGLVVELQELTGLNQRLTSVCLSVSP